MGSHEEMLERGTEGASDYFATAPVLPDIVSFLCYPLRSIPTLHLLGFRGSEKHQKRNHFRLRRQLGPW